MRRLALIFLGIVSFTLRFYKLGVIPKGISMEEASFGLVLSNTIGNWVLNPLFIRLPFAILGVFSVLAFYNLLRRFSLGFRSSYLTGFLLAITPWHIQESRIVSPGILVTFTFIVIITLVIKPIKKHSNYFPYIFIIGSLLLFTVSVVNTFSKVSNTVDVDRSLAAYIVALRTTNIFSIKLTESYRRNLELIYEHLDFGNYIFSGHPRQRGGVEESVKLFVSMIPLTLLGIMKSKKNIKFLGSIFLIFIATFVFYEFRGPSETLPVIFIFIVFAGIGVNWLLEERKLREILVVICIFLIYEFFAFNVSYFNGLTESAFSPRKAFYRSLTEKVTELRKGNERVVINGRLANPEIFFKFYTQGSDLKNFEFREFTIWNETGKKGIFVDLIPFEPSPVEPLYQKGGNFPESLNLLYQTEDKNANQKIFVYRYD